VINSKAFQTLCRTAFACEADAYQALAHFAHALQTTFLSDCTVCPTSQYGKRGRPGSGAQPDQIVYHIAGALASRLTDRQARVDQQRCFLLATNELDEGQLSAQAVLDGYKGQAQAERGFRFLKDPQFLASSLYLKKPERIMALLMVMTVCLLGYAALEDRMRTALKEHAATFPDQKGKRIQNPTARWVFHDFVGIHVLYISGQRPHDAESDRRAPAPAPTPGEAVCLVLSIKMPPNQALCAECRINGFNSGLGGDTIGRGLISWAAEPHAPATWRSPSCGTPRAHGMRMKR
jgi:hypothetical protein